MTKLPRLTSVDFIPTHRNYVDRETGAVSGLITDLALKRGKVTLDHAYHGQDNEIRQGKTIFNEITITTPVIPESIQNLIESGSPLANNDACSIANAIASVIERRWYPEQFHLVMHSSGYDSRIISKTVANLRDKYGESWLGEVLFLCWEPEGPEFKEIMELEGWSKEQYHVCYGGIQADEYYAGALDFDNCWRWTNDAQPPLWTIGPAIDYLQKSGIITKPLTKTQLIAGGGGNECFQYPPDRLIEIFYFSRWGAANSVIPYSERILPFLSYEVLRLIKLNIPVRTREEILSYLSAELLMIRKGDKDGPTTPQRQLSERLRKKCLQDFMDSWYYTNVILPHSSNYDLDMPKNIWIDDWWGVYAKASICEHLVKNGVKIIHDTI